MRAVPLALAALFAAALAAPSLRAGEMRVAGEARTAPAPASVAAPMALPGLAAALSPPRLATPSLALPGLVSPAAMAGGAPARAASDHAGPRLPVIPAFASGRGAASRAPGGTAADAPLPAPFSPGRTLLRAFSGRDSSEVSPLEISALERKSSFVARRGLRIAAALGVSAAPQSLPPEAGVLGAGPGPGTGAGQARLPAYQHVPEHGDKRRAPRPPDALPAPKPKRSLKSLFGPALAAALIALPSLVHANPFSAMAPGPRFTVTLPLVLLAAVIALVRIPVMSLLVRTNPHSLGEGDGGTDGVARLPLWAMPAVVFFFAAMEEVTFRAVGFMGAALLLFHFLPHFPGTAGQAAAAGIYAAAALASSWVFALSHRYAELWPRLVGGLVYCAALVMTGSLMFPILIHAFYNLTLFLQRRRELRAEAGGTRR